MGKDGVAIPIYDMTTKHIEATIALLKRMANDPDLDHPKVREFKKELNSRYRASDFYTGATKDFKPFALGFPDEEWVPELPALRVSKESEFNVFVTRMDSCEKGWAVITGNGRLAHYNRKWHYFADMLMAVAYARECVDIHQKVT